MGSVFHNHSPSVGNGGMVERAGVHQVTMDGRSITHETEQMPAEQTVVEMASFRSNMQSLLSASQYIFGSSSKSCGISMCLGLLKLSQRRHTTSAMMDTPTALKSTRQVVEAMTVAFCLIPRTTDGGPS
jgi:hypothetical protein